jgi:hypothetical protein
MERRSDEETLSLRLTQLLHNLPREDRKSVGNHGLRGGIGHVRTAGHYFGVNLSICELCVSRESR